MAFSFESSAGRLILVRMSGTLGDDDVGALRTRMWLTLSNVEGRAVLLGDLRRTSQFDAVVEEKLLAMLKVDNVKVERSAFIVSPDSGSFGQQLERMFAEAATEAVKSGRRPPNRRTFHDARAAQVWLDEVLVPAERKQLARFVDADPARL